MSKPSAKAALDAMIAAHVPAATAEDIVQKGITAGTYADDLAKGGAGSASAAKADLLAKGLSDEDATAAIRKMVAAGKVTDDVGLAKGVDFAAIDAALDELKKGAGAAPALSDLDFDPAAHTDALERAGALVDAVTARADEVVKSSSAGNAAMFKGYEALVGGFRGLAETVQGALVAQRTKLDEVTKGMDGIAAALNLPVPPRGVTGAVPIPHPGEIAKAGSADETFAKSEKLIAKCEAELQKGGGDAGRMKRLADAVGTLTSGASNPVELARELGIDI